MKLKLICPHYLSVRVQVKTVHRRRAVEVGHHAATLALYVAVARFLDESQPSKRLCPGPWIKGLGEYGWSKIEIKINLSSLPVCSRASEDGPSSLPRALD